MLSDSRIGRRALFACLYLSEGAPMGFLWWALPVRLRDADVAPERIAGLLALLVLPWALKFLWAPAVDVLRSPRFSVRGWILVAQLLMGLTLLPLLALDLASQFELVVLVLVVHAVAAATQDAAIDTLAIGMISLHERGSINGWMQLGMLAGRAAFGGGALLVGNRIGDEAVLAILIAVTWSVSIVVVFGVRREHVPPPPDGGRGRVAGFLAALASVARSRRTWLGLAFAALAGAGFKSLTALAGPFLVDRGVDSDTVGAFFLLPVVACMATGAVIGGWVADRWGRRRTVAVFEAAAALMVVAVGVTAMSFAPGTATMPLLAMLGALYFAIGLATASSYALFMDLTDPRLAATQFCTFMAGINLCEAWSTRTLGALVTSVGYGPGFCLMAIPSGLALLLLPLLGSPRR